ncbi:MAG: DUF2892 domain-containing protein [Methylacidiphilales bacterium]|nr:DUF2892 domain-containing protein [Candidatus Methylacidiphilales bacterium]
MNFIKKNMGKKDRILRLIAAVVFLTIGVYLSSYVLLFFALLCLFQAVFSWCLYHALTGKNTCQLQQ